MTQHVALCPVGQGHEYPGGPWYGVAASTLSSLGLLTRALTMVKLPQLTEASEDSPTRQP